MTGLEFCLISIIIGYIFYRWATVNYNVFNERRVPHEKPIPLFGNNFSQLLKKTSMHLGFLQSYRRTKQHKVYGSYNFRTPMLMINDPQLIREICVKQFDSFINRENLLTFESDPILSSLLVTMKGERWRNMRHTLSPAFTGAKMRTMFTLMIDCFDESMNYLRNQSRGSRSFEMSVNELFTKLSVDLIATTAFGLSVNSYKNENNEFYKFGKLFVGQSTQQMLKTLFLSIVPKLAKLFNFRFIDEGLVNYFTDTVVSTMKYRETHNIVRPDMIQLLMEAKKESKQDWSENEIIAQCIVFFIGALQNNANFIGTTCQLLMENPDAQERLYEEIAEVSEKLNGKTIDYDILQKMEYMDMVANESLRKYSVAPGFGRQCNKNCTIKDENGKVIFDFKVGDNLLINTIGLHWDPQYFEDPEAFKPERFSKENKDSISPYTYLPFGLGPRNCIGNRYALMQGKAMLFYLLREYRFERCEKSVKNLFEECKAFDIAAKNGFWFKITTRK